MPAREEPSTLSVSACQIKSKQIPSEDGTNVNMNVCANSSCLQCHYYKDDTWRTHTGCVWTQPQHHLLTLWEWFGWLSCWFVHILSELVQTAQNLLKFPWHAVSQFNSLPPLSVLRHQADTRYAWGNFRHRNGWKINVTWGITQKFPSNSGTFDKIIIHQANLACLSPTSHSKVQNGPVLLRSTCYNGATHGHKYILKYFHFMLFSVTIWKDFTIKTYM